MASHKETHSRMTDFHHIVNMTLYSLVGVRGKFLILVVMRGCSSMGEACSRMCWIPMDTVALVLMSHLEPIRFTETLTREVSIRKRLQSNTSRSLRRKATRRSSTSLSPCLSSQSSRKFTHVSIHRQNGRKKGRKQSREGSKDYTN